MINTEFHIFEKVFSKISDQGGYNEKQIEWCVDTYNLILKDYPGLVDKSNTDLGNRFMFAIATSFILENFYNRLTYDFFREVSQDIELEFDDFGIRFVEVLPFLLDISKDRKNKILENQSIELQDIWVSLWKFVEIVFTALDQQCKKSETKSGVFDIMIDLYARVDEETGDPIDPYMSNSHRMNAYSFVLGRFQY